MEERMASLKFNQNQLIFAVVSPLNEASSQFRIGFINTITFIGLFTKNLLRLVVASEKRKIASGKQGTFLRLSRTAFECSSRRLHGRSSVWGRPQLKRLGHNLNSFWNAAYPADFDTLLISNGPATKTKKPQSTSAPWKIFRSHPTW